jgi:hypothetical protein
MSNFNREMYQDDEKLYSMDFHNLCMLFTKYCLNDKTIARRVSRMRKMRKPQICRKAVRTIEPRKIMHIWEDNIDMFLQRRGFEVCELEPLGSDNALILSSSKKRTL